MKLRKKYRLNPEITTKRLTAELLSENYIEFFKKLTSNIEVHQMMKTKDPEDPWWTSLDFLKMQIKYGPIYVWFYNGLPIGTGGFYIRNTSGTAELNYVLLPQYWNMGFATEILEALIKMAKNIGLEKLTLEIHPTNKKSQRVALKNGFKFSRVVKKFRSEPEFEYVLNID